MSETGLRLKTLRIQSNLTLRDVEKQSRSFAEAQHDLSYLVSASWLNRLERGDNEMTIHKFIVLAYIFNVTLETLLAITHGRERTSLLRQFSLPNATMLLTPGGFDDHARSLLQGLLSSDNLPNETQLLPARDQEHADSRYRQAIIGKNDSILHPMIPPGSIIVVDTQQRKISHRKSWRSEFLRPIYLLLTHDSYVCSWCELDETSDWLTLMPHPLSTASLQRWKYRKQIENLGRVVTVTMPWAG